MKIWNKTQDIKLDVKLDEKPGFYMWYEDEVDKDTKDALDEFVNWVFNNYNVTTPVYINCVNKDYVTYENDDNEQGYIFNWYTTKKVETIDNIDDCPDILLPVKIGEWEFEDILRSLVEAITLYFAWCLNELNDNFTVDEEEVQEIIDKYYALCEE